MKERTDPENVADGSIDGQRKFQTKKWGKKDRLLRLQELELENGFGDDGDVVQAFFLITQNVKIM